MYVKNKNRRFVEWILGLNFPFTKDSLLILVYPMRKVSTGTVWNIYAVAVYNQTFLEGNTINGFLKVTQPNIPLTDRF